MFRRVVGFLLQTVFANADYRVIAVWIYTHGLQETAIEEIVGWVRVAWYEMVAVSRGTATNLEISNYYTSRYLLYKRLNMCSYLKI